MKEYDYGIIQTCKTQLINADRTLYAKMKLLIDHKHPLSFIGGLDVHQKQLVMEGAALMYQLINNPDFLKNE